MAQRVESAKSSRRMSAKHEAAHAVVSVRLGLPLASTDIRQRRVPMANGAVLLSCGYTTLEPGTADRWIAALPDPEAARLLTATATQAAAGCMADRAAGLPPGDVGVEGDVESLLQCAAALGVATVRDDPALAVWLADRLNEAAALLYSDDGAAWDRVRVTLERKGTLTGAEVRALVERGG